MANYTLILDYAQRGGTPPESIDLRLVKRVFFCEDGRSFKIQLEKRELSFTTDSKESLEPWKSLLEVYNGRPKVWSPVPIPVSFHRAIAKCIAFLLRPGAASEEEGIFRVSASSTDIQDLFTLLMTTKEGIPEESDCHVVGGCLKKLLRDLPETLLTKKLYLFLTQSSPPPVASEVAESVSSLPPANRDLLLSLFQLLVLVAANKSKTKMDMAGLEICILPTLGLKEKSVIENMRDSLEPLFAHYEKLLGYEGDGEGEGDGLERRPRVVSMDVPLPTIPQELKDKNDTRRTSLSANESGLAGSFLPPKKKTVLPPKKKRGAGSVGAVDSIHVHRSESSTCTPVRGSAMGDSLINLTAIQTQDDKNTEFKAIDEEEHKGEL